MTDDIAELVKELVKALEATDPFINSRTFPGTGASVRKQIDAALAAARSHLQQQRGDVA